MMEGRRPGGGLVTVRVSVIIPTYHDDAGLLQTLRALEHQTFSEDAFEILVVDNTPEFRLESRAGELPRVRLLHEPQRGSYAARNRGLAEARGDVLAFTDADCLPAPDWIERAVEALEVLGRPALLVGRIELFPRDPDHPTASELFEIARGFQQESYARRFHFGATANVVTTRAVVEKAGGFEARLTSSGDREFGNRVHRAGIPVEYAHDVVVRHPARASLGQLLAKVERVTRGSADLVRLGELSPSEYRRSLVQDLLPPRYSLLVMLRDTRLGGLERRLRAAGVLLVVRYFRALVRIRMLLKIARQSEVGPAARHRSSHDQAPVREPPECGGDDRGQGER